MKASDINVRDPFILLEGSFYFTMHSPNAPSTAERVRLFSIKEIQSKPFLKFI